MYAESSSKPCGSRRWLLLSFVLITLLLSLAAQSGLAGTINVAIAANFTDAARDLAKQFEQETGHTVKISFGSTGKLYSQIEKGAPFHIFLAADIDRPKKAAQAGLALPDSLFIYAKGRLVLWSAIPELFTDAPAFLADSQFKRLAIANPKTAPYGLAAKQVLETLDLWPATQVKLVRGDSIAQTFQFVATRNAELGFVAASQAQAWSEKTGAIWLVPNDYHAPIAQGAVLVTKGKDNPAALGFMDFLKSDKAKAIITGYGYEVD